MAKVKLEISFSYIEEFETGLVDPSKMAWIKTVEMSTQREKLIKKIREMPLSQLARCVRVNFVVDKEE